MQPELNPRTGYPGTATAGQIGAQQQRVLRNTYLLLALTMIPTVIGAMVGMAVAPVIMQHPIMTMIVLFAAVIGIQFAIAKHRDSGLGVALLLGMTFLLGLFLGPLLTVALSLRNGPQLIGYAAVGTGAIFFIMAGIATTSKRDYSFMGKFLFVGMIVALIAIVANLFLQIPAFSLAISAIIVVVFSLFLLHDVSRIVHGGETNYVMATTGVYLSLFNIFANLLQLLMAFGGEKD
jgi:FtsH-binding integral membrane protein